jgi:hypothetical protein
MVLGARWSSAPPGDGSLADVSCRKNYHETIANMKVFTSSIGMDNTSANVLIRPERGNGRRFLLESDADRRHHSAVSSVPSNALFAAAASSFGGYSGNKCPF